MAIVLLAALFPAVIWAAEPVPRSVLILDQSDAESAWYAAFSPAFRSTLRSGSERPISVYSEHLDLSRFPTADHDKARRNYLRDKFRDRSIGVLVAQGSSALEFVMRSRADLWPGVPVVFASLDAATAARLNLPPDVTGTIRQLTFRNTVITAQALVPDLKRIALVGDAWERQAVRRQYEDELPAFAAKFEFIDLIGLPMTEIRKRVAVLPDNTAIIYTAVNLDGAGVSYRPHEALAEIAEVANRPVVIDVETNIGHGGTGGLVSHPALIGRDAARIALRIINGERPSDIPITESDVIKPVFDWRQLQRFGISESRLPPGSEIRFRSPTVWQQYRWQMIALVSALLLQGALITWLLFERYRRHRAELESRRRLLEVIHLNRTAAAGALSASFAHELNQPLGAILSNAETAEALLSTDPPDLEQLKEILADIRRDDQRAADIIDHLRGLLRRKNDAELQEFDLNEVVRGAARLLSPEATARGVELGVSQAQATLPVRADEVHLQQVVLNLAMNGMDAMLNCAPGSRSIRLETALVGEAEAEVSVSDSGTGIPSGKLKEIFETFYTTKPQGTGLGLSIARTIIETYGGRIWAENRTGGGAAFRFTLPLIKAQTA